MGNKKFDLSSNLVKVPKVEAVSTITDEKSEKRVTMTFGVTEDFRSEYKIWCAKNKMDMKKALIESFQLIKNHYSDFDPYKQ